jgi:hypothetical protein
MNAPAPQVIKMYAKREDIFPREVKGHYQNLRWICLILTQLVFYGAPWLQWHGRQAILSLAWSCGRRTSSTWRPC